MQWCYIMDKYAFRQNESWFKRELHRNLSSSSRSCKKKYQPGHAVTAGMAAAANVKLEDAEKKGARFIFGGPGFVDATGASLKPTIVTDVRPDMKIWDEETFGPSASLYTFKTDEEAIEMANNSEYGLNAAIHTTNMERGITISRELEVGQVHINNMTEYDECKFPTQSL